MMMISYHKLIAVYTHIQRFFQFLQLTSNHHHDSSEPFGQLEYLVQYNLQMALIGLIWSF